MHGVVVRFSLPVLFFLQWCHPRNASPVPRISILRVVTTRLIETTTTIMAQMARGEGYREEQTSDEDDIVGRRGRGRVLMGTDEYIESESPHLKAHCIY
jgi:hypothetical protein